MTKPFQTVLNAKKFILMKKLYLVLIVFLFSFTLVGQNVASIRLGSTDASELVAGDVVSVPVYLDTITPGTVALGFDFLFAFDHSVLVWNGAYTTYVGEESEWVFNDNGVSLVGVWADPTFQGISFEDVPILCEVYFEYIYTGGETQFVLDTSSTIGFGPWFETTWINGCVCSPVPNPVVFHVTSGGANLADAEVLVNSEVDTTNVSGNAVFYFLDGEYNYTVQKPGYENQEGVFEVVGEMQTIMIDLEPVYYEVVFEISCCDDPIEGIEILIGTESIITAADGIAVISLPMGDYVYDLEYLSGTFSVPEATTIALDICGQTIFNVSDETGNPLTDVMIHLGEEILLTDFSGQADTCLFVGSYNYIATKPGYISQSGSFAVDTISQTIGLVMEETTWSVDFSCYVSCENQFNGWMLYINEDTLTPGQTVLVPEGVWDFSISWLDCNPASYGTIDIQSSINIDCGFFGDMEPHTTFYVSSSQAGAIEGAEVIVDNFALVTNLEGEAGFCLPGGTHTYSVINEGYDTLNGVFNYFNYCQDTSLNILLNPVGIENLKTKQFILNPNPTHGKFVINSGLSNLGLVDIRIMDLTGNIIFSNSYHSTNKIWIDLSDQPKGLYFIQLKSGETIQNEKLILQ